MYRNTRKWNREKVLDRRLAMLSLVSLFALRNFFVNAEPNVRGEEKRRSLCAGLKQNNKECRMP